MALCEKCSATIPDGETLCENCANQAEPVAPVWSRPGSIPNAGNTFVAVQEQTVEVKPAQTEASEPVYESAAQEVAQPQYQTNGELDRRVKQTEYFNSVANVEEEQPITDISELFPTTNLLEVPFRDTEYNIGYKIPKMKVAVSKQTRRNLFFGSAIFSGVALIIAAIILLDSVFGIFPKSVETPIMYVKSSKIYLTSSKGKLPEQVKYDGSTLQVTNGIQKIHFSPYSDDVLVVSDYIAKSNSYSLHLRRGGDVTQQGVLIDNNIIGDFKYVLGGKGIAYLKGTGVTDLYVYDFEKGESTKIHRSVRQFSLLSDKKLVYACSNGDIKSIDLTAEGTTASETIVKNTLKVYFDKDASSAFYYIKNIKNTETGISANELYKYNGGELIKLMSEVDDVVTYSGSGDWVYFTSNNEDVVSIADYIDDDCLERDQQLSENLDWDVSASADMIDIIRRQNIRRRAFGNTYEMNSMSLYYYKNGEISTLTDRCSDVLLTADGTVNGKKIETNVNDTRVFYGGDGIVYTVMESAKERIKFSEMPSEMLSYSAFVNYMGDFIKAKNNSTAKYVATDRKIFQLNVSGFNVDNFAFSADCKSMYYIDTLDDADTGDLIQITVNDKGFGTPEAIAVDVKKIAVMADGVVVYIDSGDTAYAGSVAIANRVSELKFNQSATALAIIAETIDTGGRLVVFKDNTAKAIADAVKLVCFNNDTTLSYIKDYDKVARYGDLYICNNFNSASRIDNGVTALVELEY